jgi:hypothetical protein
MFSAGHNRCPTCAALNLKKHSSLHAAECGLLKKNWLASTHENFNGNFRILKYPKMEVLYHIRPYVVGIFPNISLI